MSDSVMSTVAKEIKESHVRKLIAHSRTCFDLIHSAGESYAVPNGRISDSRVALPIKGTAFRRYLIKDHGRANTGVRPSDLDLVTSALDALAFDGPEKSLAFRFHHDIGTNRAGPNGDWPSVTIDLGREDGLCVEVDVRGWAVRPSPDHIAWRRSPTMKPLPVPDTLIGGRVDELAEILALDPNGEAFRAIVGWVVGLPFVEDVRPGLLLVGPPGSGKSTRLRLATSIFEPSDETALGKSFGHKADDDEVRAYHRVVPLWDNLSRISGQVSDSLCTIVTGTAREGRTLYSNSDMSSAPIKRPVGMTAVDIPAGLRPDALERLTVVEVPAIPERTPDSQIQQRFDEAHPRLLAAFCDALAIVLRGTRIRRKDWPIQPPPPKRLKTFRMAGHASRLDILDHADGFTSLLRDVRHLPCVQREDGQWVPLADQWPPRDWTPEEAETELAKSRAEGMVVQFRDKDVSVYSHLPSAQDIGLPAGLLDVYAELGQRVRAASTQEDAFPAAVIALAASSPGTWQGSAKDLLHSAVLKAAGAAGGPGWPASPRGVVTALRQHQAGLSDAGVDWHQSLTPIRGYKLIYLTVGDPA
jgi:energy-coupling factor transporter ATP-binding protein EcfA2